MKIPDGFIVWDAERHMRKFIDAKMDMWDMENMLIQEIHILLASEGELRVAGLRLYHEYLKHATVEPFSPEEEKALGI